MRDAVPLREARANGGDRNGGPVSPRCVHAFGLRGVRSDTRIRSCQLRGRPVSALQGAFPSSKPIHAGIARLFSCLRTPDAAEREASTRLPGSQTRRWGGALGAPLALLRRAPPVDPVRLHPRYRTPSLEGGHLRPSLSTQNGERGLRQVFPRGVSDLGVTRAFVLDTEVESSNDELSRQRGEYDGANRSIVGEPLWTVGQQREVIAALAERLDSRR